MGLDLKDCVPAAGLRVVPCALLLRGEGDALLGLCCCDCEVDARAACLTCWSEEDTEAPLPDAEGREKSCGMALRRFEMGSVRC